MGGGYTTKSNYDQYDNFTASTKSSVQMQKNNSSSNTNYRKAFNPIQPPETYSTGGYKA